MTSCFENIASVIEHGCGFKPAMVCAVDIQIVEAVNWTLMIAGGLLTVSLLVTNLARGRHVLGDFHRLQSDRFPPEMIIVPIFVYLFAGLAGNPVAEWILRYTSTVGKMAEEAGEGSTELSALLAHSFALAAGGVACYFVGRRFIGTDGNSFMHGRGSVGKDALEGLVGAVIAFAACPALLYVTQEVILLFRPEYVFPEHNVIDALRDPNRPVWLPFVFWLSVGFLTPVAEELFFRGIVHNVSGVVVKNRMLMIVLAGSFFGFCHNAQPQVVPAIALFGVILGILYERRGSLIGPIVAHILFNCRTLLWESLR